MNSTMAEVAAREIERWPAGEPLSAWPTMQAITLEVIMRTVFGVTDSERLKRLGDVLREHVSWVAEPRRLAMIALLGPRRLAKNRSFQHVMQPADELIFEEIRARREASDLEERDDVLSLLLQARHDDGSAMSDEELRDELMTLLVAGHETSATALAWALEALAATPPRSPGSASEVDAGQDEYLDAVIKETLRLRPVLAVVLRRLTEPMEIGGRLLPAGVNVAPCIYLIHRRRGRLPGPARVPARALPRAAAGHLHLDPVRRRRAALPRGELRPVRDEGGAARAGCAARHPGGAPRPGAPRAAGDRVRARARRRDRRGAPRANARVARRGGRLAHQRCAPALGDQRGRRRRRPERSAHLPAAEPPAHPVAADRQQAVRRSAAAHPEPAALAAPQEVPQLAA